MKKRIYKYISVFLDSGCQMFFVPLCKPETYSDLSQKHKYPASLTEAITEIENYEKILPKKTREIWEEHFSKKKKEGWIDKSPYKFLKTKYGQKTWNLEFGSVTLNGIWYMIETNTCDQNANSRNCYDRGYFYQSNGFTEEEKDSFIEATKKNELLPEGKESPYIALKAGESLSIPLPEEAKESSPDEAKESLPEEAKESLPEETKESSPDEEFEFRVMLVIKTPNADPLDVDVILDLGNTRTAGLLFEHSSKNEQFASENFRQVFKILRIKPDPVSGEFDSLDDVETGIAQSWMVIHQLENQKYLEREITKQVQPAFLLTEYHDVKVEKHTSGLLFKRTNYKISGTVRQLIPQMFTRLSPVMIGDQAKRAFNSPYARSMISVGAKLQQSSPKRYYWDDTKGDTYWNMLLYDWDKAYNDKPKDAAAIPTLQGEMLRFIQENGVPLDLSEEREPAEAPKAYPEKPAYPRQSTLTWFLLHILERAYSQVNSAFVSGANFVPHRLRKIQITYPSGWTNDEIERYRKRCQEALDIFSQTNIYHGIKSPFRLEMVARENTPDEAVASQLPFVFSEIIRYHGQTAAKWISLVGKKRQGTDTVRIMNFDIGGGTSDISIVEYKDLNNNNAKIAQNLLSTCLLFKDGQTTAGDDLIKKIIERIILGGLLRITKTIPGITDNIIRKFTQTDPSHEEQIIRGRIVRTCLIPLATMCLSSLGEDSVQFSPQQAGVNQNNWNEFLDFIGIPEDAAISTTQACFSFNSHEINELIDALFANLFQVCAMYAAAYDIDILIFSGKPSELPYIKTMAKRYIPIDEGRIIFAREFKAGHWYPFTDDKGYIKDAKTVTVVGSALYYALSKGLIAGWKIETEKYRPTSNEWGQLDAMENARTVFLSKTEEETEVAILPNTIIARRQNICSSPEPVYKFIPKNSNAANNTVKVLLRREKTNDGESLTIASIDGSPEKIHDYELKLWPCKKADGFAFWQDEGLFEDLQEFGN